MSDAAGTADEARQGPRGRREVGPDLYGLVLVLLSVSYVLFAVSSGTWAQVAVAVLLLGSLVLAVRTSVPSPRMRTLVRTVVGVGLVATVVALVLLPERDAVAVVDATLAAVVCFTLVVVLGGLGRLVGLLLTGIPSLFMLGGLLMELVVTPVLCLWQTRIANAYSAGVNPSA